MEDFVIVKLKRDSALFVADLNLKQRRLQVVSICMQELILADDTVKIFGNQGQVALGKAHLTIESTEAVGGRGNSEVTDELA